MSLYCVQNLIFQLNRDPPVRARFEIRTFIAVAGATDGAKGNFWFYAPIPIFAVGCTVSVMDVT